MDRRIQAFKISRIPFENRVKQFAGDPVRNLFTDYLTQIFAECTSRIIISDHHTTIEPVIAPNLQKEIDFIRERLSEYEELYYPDIMENIRENEIKFKNV